MRKNVEKCGKMRKNAEKCAKNALKMHYVQLDLEKFGLSGTGDPENFREAENFLSPRNA